MTTQSKWTDFQRDAGLSDRQIEAVNVLMEFAAFEHARSGRWEAAVPFSVIAPSESLEPTGLPLQDRTAPSWLVDLMRKSADFEVNEGGVHGYYHHVSLVNQWSWDHINQLIRFSANPIMGELFLFGSSADNG